VAHSKNFFLIKWILKVGEQSFNSVFSSTKIPDFYFSSYGGIEYFFTFSCTPSQIPLPGILTRFWRDSIKAWLSLKHNIDILKETKRDPTLCREIYGKLAQNQIPLFLNKNIVDNGKILFHKRWINRDLKFIDQLINTNGDIIEFSCLPDCIKNLPEFFVIYNGIKFGFQRLKRLHRNPINFLRDGHLQRVKLMKLKNSVLRALIDFDANLVIYGKNFWLQKLKSDIFLRYIHSMNSVKETKLQVTLFKLFHNILPSRILLKKMEYYRK